MQCVLQLRRESENEVGPDGTATRRRGRGRLGTYGRAPEKGTPRLVKGLGFGSCRGDTERVLVPWLHGLIDWILLG